MTARAMISGQEGAGGAVVSRFAPSPTGRLHLGHAWSAIRAHDLAMAAGGRFLLRIEDIDGTRSRAEHVDTILADMAWLGLRHEAPVFQSQRLALYDAALDGLKARGLAYPCFCTRAEIAASAAAPHGPAAAYPGTCRAMAPEERRARMGEAHCWRLDMAAAIESLFSREGGNPVLSDPLGGAATGPPPSRGNGQGSALRWHDVRAGWVEADSAAQGDVVLARKDAPASYHLAVTIDDAAQGVTDVVRGVDLFDATHIHRLLQALLGLPTPRYHHHALLTGADGERLAKRHGSPTLAAMRAAGVDGRAVAEDLRQGLMPTGFSVASA